MQPGIFGHAHAPILSAVRRALQRGTSYGAPCRAEVELAEISRVWNPPMGLDHVALTAFIELMAPNLSRKLVEQVLAGERDSYEL